MSDQAAQRTTAFAERNRILLAMDVDAAKSFIVEHGGTVPKRPLNWERVLHLARFEVATIPDELRADSRIYLARNGAQSLLTLPHGSPYVRAALDLIFPKRLTDAHIRKIESER